MSKVKLTFLGTGTSQGIPIIGSDHPVCLSTNSKDKRLRTSAMLSWGDYNFVIDTGPDFRQQMLRENVSKLSGVLYTHEHTDHIIGLDDIRPFFYRDRVDIPIYAEERVLDALVKRFQYILESDSLYPGTPNVVRNIIREEEKIYLGGKEIIPIRVMHGKLPIVGYKVENLMYCTDVKTVPETSMKYFENLEVLVINALRTEQHYTHFTLEEALQFIKEVKPKKAYLTHISHLLGFHDEVEAELPDNVYLAYDGLKIEL